MKAYFRPFPVIFLGLALLFASLMVDALGIGNSQSTVILDGFTQLESMTASTVASKPAQKQLLASILNARQQYEQGAKFLDEGKVDQAKKKLAFALDRLAEYRTAVGAALAAQQVSASNAYLLQQKASEIEQALGALISGNHTPIANAGTDQTVTKGRLVTLDGSGSSDVDGDALTYLWQITQKPVGSQANLNNPAVLMPTFIADQIGEYTVSLQVNDGKASSQKDILIVTTKNSPPVANAGIDQQVYSGASVTLDGSASGDVDGDALSYGWELVSKPANSTAVLNSTTVVKPVFTADLAGQYIIRLTVSDTYSSSAPDTVTVNVETTNARPVADAGADQSVYVGTAVTLDGSASYDADGNPLVYRWAMLSKPQGSQAVLSGAGAVTASFTADKAGQYVAQLIVNDGLVDSEVDQVVVSTANSRPVADAGSAATYTVGATATLDASSSHDADGNALSYHWSLSSKPVGSAATVVGADTVSPQLLLDKVGTFVAQLVVNDGVLDSDPATVALIAEADTVPPTKPDTGKITVSIPGADGKVTVTGQANSVEPGATVVITNTRTGESITVVADSEGRFTAQLPGQVGDTYSVLVKDAAGNSSEAGSVGGNGTPLPPDPKTVATPLDATGYTPLGDASKFLYTGSNPIQTGVADGTIDAKRAAVIRGAVFDKDKQPLSGVAITIKDHPELGQTLSRADGIFDMVVNGGGLLTVNYGKLGYLPVQRQVQTPWEDYAHVDDAILLTADPTVSVVNLMDTSQPFHVAQGSVSTDTDGERRATVLFPQGTAATMTLADGSHQPLGTLSVRATEYTVGENGEKRMPGPLPPTSGYTYAVDLSVDEAVAAGAKRVDFSKPLPIYVDNFLGFPTGEAVPAGWYDYEKVAWIPSNDGVVIKVLREDNGQAVVDVSKDGTDNEATQEQLDALGITPTELGQLAGLYDPGKSLWRVPVTHFTPWDFNWPYGPPPGAKGPPNDPPKNDDDKNPDKECDKPGCVVSLESQTLGEDFGVSGTPFSLHYSSARMPGRTTGRSVTIPLSDDTIPSTVEAIVLTINIAGQTIERSFQPKPNQTYDFVWDGKDGYGRDVIGSRKASISVGYRYPIMYYSSAGGFSSSFGGIGGGVAVSLDGSRANAIGVVLQRRMEVNLYAFVEKTAGLGEMGLDIHHAYDPTTGMLYMGDGKKRSATNLNSGVLEVFAGGGTYNGDGRKATETKIQAYYVDEGTDGSIYFSNTLQIRKIAPDGIVSTVLGNGERGEPNQNEGQLANTVPLGAITNFCLSPDNRMYFVEANYWGGENSHIRYVDSMGKLRTLAHLPAYDITDVHVANDGNVYVTAEAANTVFKIDPVGNVVSVMSYDGLFWPWGVNTLPDGSVFISNTFGHEMIIIDRFGQKKRISVAWPQSLSFDESQNVYISTGGYSNVSDGIYRYSLSDDSFVALSAVVYGQGTTPAENIKLSSAKFYDVRSIHYSQHQGALFIPYGERIFVVRNHILPKASLSDYLISSENGSEVYHFDARGRHLETLDAITKIAIYTFGYDANGLLATITDKDGDITHITRDASGKPLSITAPDGQETHLAVNAEGYVQQITDAANQPHQMEYVAGGLLSRYTDPRGNVSTYGYDAKGMLLKDNSPIGGGWTLARTDSAAGHEVTVTSGEGREEKYKVERDALGAWTRTNRGSDGLVTVSTESADSGSLSLSHPDGTALAVTQAPDPRFGMQSPYAASSKLVTPSGLTLQTNTTRLATLSDPADLFSLQTQVETTAINGKTYARVYDAASRTWSETSAESRASTVITDNQGRPVRVQTSGLNPALLAYDNRGRLQTATVGEGADARTSAFTYHTDSAAKGYLASVTDAAGRTTHFQQDAVGRITQQTLPDGRTVGYSYDANGNLASLTPPGRDAHVFNYTAGDQTGSYNPPQVNGADTLTQYTYNRDKQLTQVTRPDGKSVVFNHNATSGKLDSIAIARGNYTLLYNSTTGKLETLTAPDGNTLAYTYDGSLPLATVWAGDINGTVSRVWDNDLQVHSLSVNGDATSFAYDNDGLLTQAGSLTLSHEAQKGGLTNGTTLGSVTTSQTYNGFGEMENYTASSGGNTLAQWGYTRDKLGRITAKTEMLNGVSHTYGYTYDTAGRLKTVTQDGSTVGDYSYDANSNRNGGTYDAQDRLLTWGTNSYTYSTNGELQSKTNSGATTTYSYDELGNLLQAKLPGDVTLDYVVDGQNRRIGKKVNGVLKQGFLYQNQLNPIAELDGDGNVVARFVYADKGNVPAYMVKGGKTYRIISDHLGSPRLTVDAETGATVQQMEYDVWGKVISDTNPGFQPFGFAGGLYDQHTGLVRFGARDYDPETGRWTVKDPGGFNGGLNLYGYTFSDPVNLVDMDGNLPLLPQGLVDAAAGFGDGVSNGLTGYVREMLDIDGGVDACGGVYRIAELVGEHWPTNRGKEGYNVLNNIAGRAGKQARLRELLNDLKLGSADRGWIQQEINSINRGQRNSIRNPLGKDLAHERGREAAKGYGYEYSNLQDRDLHRLQHKYDNYGRSNKERPL